MTQPCHDCGEMILVDPDLAGATFRCDPCAREHMAAATPEDAALTAMVQAARWDELLRQLRALGEPAADKAA